MDKTHVVKSEPNNDSFSPLHHPAPSPPQTPVSALRPSYTIPHVTRLQEMRDNCCQASTLPSQDVADEPSYDDDAPSASGDGAQFGLSDAEFETLLARALQQSPMYHEYLTVFQAAPKIMTEWRQRYRGNPALWKRLFQKDRVIKEFVEAAPIIDAVKRLVDDAVLVNGQQFTIFDLACGRGYLSMTLSHLLPPEKVKKLVLVDKQWPMHNMTPKPHHISWTHIYGSHKKVEDQSIPCYFDTWPIELHTSKMVSN